MSEHYKFELRTRHHIRVHTHFQFTVYMSCMLILLKCCDSMRPNQQWNCCPCISLSLSLKVQKLQNSNFFCIVIVVVDLFRYKSWTHTLKHRTLHSFHYIKKSYARYFNIPIMFKCFQNLSASHQKSCTIQANAHTQRQTFGLANDSALIIYSLSIQRNKRDHRAFFLHFHLSWARLCGMSYVSYWHTFLTTTCPPLIIFNLFVFVFNLFVM